MFELTSPIAYIYHRLKYLVSIIKKYRIQKILSLLLTIILLGIILAKSKEQLSRIRMVTEFNFISLLLISFFFVMNQLAFGFQLKIIASAFDVSLTFKEWFGLISIQSMGNYFPLSTGTISNITYLKIKKNLMVSDYIGYFTGDTILKIAIYSGLGTVLILIFKLIDKNLNFMTFLITALFFIASMFFILLPRINSKSRSRFINVIFNIHSGWIKIRQNKKVLLINITIHCFTLIFISFQYYIIFKELYYSISIVPIFFLTILTNLIRIASLFPGNLGLRESVSGFVLQSFGFPFGIGVTVSLVGRIISLVWIFLFGLIFTNVLVNSGGKIFSK